MRAFQSKRRATTTADIIEFVGEGFELAFVRDASSVRASESARSQARARTQARVRTLARAPCLAHLARAPSQPRSRLSPQLATQRASIRLQPDDDADEGGDMYRADSEPANGAPPA